MTFCRRLCHYNKATLWSLKSYVNLCKVLIHSQWEGLKLWWFFYIVMDFQQILNWFSCWLVKSNALIHLKSSDWWFEGRASDHFNGPMKADMLHHANLFHKHADKNVLVCMMLVNTNIQYRAHFKRLYNIKWSHPLFPCIQSSQWLVWHWRQCVCVYLSHLAINQLLFSKC